MVVEPSTTRLTYEDYRDLPDDGKRYELIDGDLNVTPAPATRHQVVVIQLVRSLGDWVLEQKLGVVFTAPYDIVLSAEDVVQPDLVYIAEAHRGRVKVDRFDGPPDLVVEVLSEHHRRRDEVIKLHLYERHGVGEYWIVDPELETVKVFELTDGSYRRSAELSAEAGDVLSSHRIPGFEVEVARLFSF